MATSVTVQAKISAILPTRDGVLYRDVTNMQGTSCNCKFLSARDLETNSSDGKWQSFYPYISKVGFPTLAKISRALSFLHTHTNTHTHKYTHTNTHTHTHTHTHKHTHTIPTVNDVKKILRFFGTLHLHGRFYFVTIFDIIKLLSNVNFVVNVILLTYLSLHGTKAFLRS